MTAAGEWVVTIEAAGAGADEELVEHLVNTLPSAAASGGAGHVGVTFTVDASSAQRAVSAALAMWKKVTTHAVLDVTHVEASTAARADAELERANFPALLGVAELAERLGVSKARASELARIESFPHPVAHLASGPVWTEPSISGHLEGWQRKPGRPRKADALEVALAAAEEARRGVADAEAIVAAHPGDEARLQGLSAAKAMLELAEAVVQDLRGGGRSS